MTYDQEFIPRADGSYDIQPAGVMLLDPNALRSWTV
jgi:hypothetical protein